MDFGKDQHKHTILNGITNGIDSKRVNNGDIIPNGWRQGRTIKKRIKTS